MTRKRKLIISITLPVTTLLVGLAVLLGLLLWQRPIPPKYDFSALNGSANKVVLFIGDGMGKNHIKTTQAYYEEELFLSSFGEQGDIKTYSLTKFRPTDSAAAGSALSTGKKYKNGEVARRAGQDVETISEYAKKKGFGVGVVTTDGLSGATPASFSSHANYRKDQEEIVTGQINSGVDLFLGAGDYSNYQTRFENKGYTYFNDFESLKNSNANKVVGVFENIYAEKQDGMITLSMMTDYAVDFLEEHFPQGYFLMVECAHIDKRSHGNNMIEMVKYLYDFNTSIEQTHAKLSAVENSAILVTADHETGGLRYKNQTKEQISNKMFSRTGHSSANVPYHIYLNTTKDIVLKEHLKPTMDNTHIFEICRAFLTNESA